MSFKKAEIETLVELANRLDAEEKTDQAMVVDAAIAKLIKSAAEEEEEEKEATSGLTSKQKSALKALHNAADRVTRVFGNRIPRNCKKLDDLAEQVLEACKNVDLD